MEPEVLTPAQRELHMILRTTYAHGAVRMRAILGLLERQAGEERVSLMGTLLRWARLFPVNERLIDATPPPPVTELEAARDSLSVLTRDGQVEDPQAFNLEATLPEAATAVLRQLDRLAEHGSLVQAIWLVGILRHNAPFLLDVPVNASTVCEKLFDIVTQWPSLLVELEAILSSPAPVSTLARWLAGLQERTDDRELAERFANFTLVRVISILERSEGEFPVPFVLAVAQPDDDFGGSTPPDPKTAN